MEKLLRTDSPGVCALMSSDKGKTRNQSVAPVVLAILDGWGYRDQDSHNAIRTASTPVMDALWHAYPHSLIEASGAHVGLPDDQMGNSEVGHLTIGAGRIIRQELVRISETVRNNELSNISALTDLGQSLQRNQGTLHLLGLCSDGGVHSHVDHLCGLLRWAADMGIARVAIHAITDGRDTPTESAPGYLQQVQTAIESTGVGEIASLCGRYWAMDRDHRWERTAKAYTLLTDPSVPLSDLDAQAALQASYKAGITDEFLEPVRLTDAVFNDGDGLVMFNFRPDRARQLVQAITVDSFDGFDRSHQPKLEVVTFTQYESGLPVTVAFPPESLDHLLGQVVSEHGLKQYRTAETEKYPHVTYFLNGGIEQPLEGEDRHLVPSPRVATYDEAPAMSADVLTDSCIAAIERGHYSLVVINYANPDMVGHTGSMEAAIIAVETVDQCTRAIVEKGLEHGYSFFILADHGNADCMKNADGSPHTAHTTQPVPFHLVSPEGHQAATLADGVLGDVAPTILAWMGVEQPEAMTGKSLLG